MSSQVLEKYYKEKTEVKNEFSNEALARHRAFHTRHKSLETLDKQLLDFESHFSKFQGKISWASNAQAGAKELLELAGNKAYTRQHRLLNELELINKTPSSWHFFDKDYYSFQESNANFPEWDVQSEKVKNITERKSIDSDATAILYPEFYISENGSLLLANNDPFVNELLRSCQKIIFVLGIEQVCPSMSDSEYLLSLLARHRYGKSEMNDYTFVFGGGATRETHRHVDYHVLLLDNGRTDILSHIPQRQALYCINCGACKQESNHLPVDANKPAIIDAIKLAFANENDEKAWSNLFDYPLSSRATENCPVNIDLKGLLLHTRNMAIEKKKVSRSDSYAWIAWRKAMLSRKWLNKGAQLKNFTFKSFFKKAWGEEREFPRIKEKSFNDWWLETRGKEEI